MRARLERVEWAMNASQTQPEDPDSLHDAAPPVFRSLHPSPSVESLGGKGRLHSATIETNTRCRLKTWIWLGIGTRGILISDSPALFDGLTSLAGLTMKEQCLWAWLPYIK